MAVAAVVVVMLGSAGSTSAHRSRSLTAGRLVPALVGDRLAPPARKPAATAVKKARSLRIAPQPQLGYACPVAANGGCSEQPCTVYVSPASGGAASGGGGAAVAASGGGGATSGGGGATVAAVSVSAPSAVASGSSGSGCTGANKAPAVVPVSAQAPAAVVSRVSASAQRSPAASAMK
ncbi:MAG: hypothetical protein ABSG43_14620 [Solirubrobacteraceae bacterium]